MMRQVDVGQITERLKHYSRLALAGVRADGYPLGPIALVWTMDRAGKERWEALPLWLAELRVASIPFDEPDVARARLITG